MKPLPTAIVIEITAKAIARMNLSLIIFLTLESDSAVAPKAKI